MRTDRSPSVRIHDDHRRPMRVREDLDDVRWWDQAAQSTTDSTLNPPADPMQTPVDPVPTRLAQQTLE